MNALDTIRQRAGQLQPRIAVVLGSGWGGLTEHIVDAIQIPYTELDGFPQPTVAGHLLMQRAPLAGGVLQGTLARQRGKNLGLLLIYTAPIFVSVSVILPGSALLH